MMTGPLRKQVLVRKALVEFWPISNEEGFKIVFRLAEGRPECRFGCLPYQKSATILPKTEFFLY
jgi:hypothetical protein